MNRFFSKTNTIFSLKPLKFVILATAFACLFCSFFDEPISYLFHIPGPQAWFSLSYWGLNHYFFFEILTYFFVSPVFGKFSLSLVFYLLFNLYFTWSIGSSLIQMKGSKDFVKLYYGGGILAGIVGAFLLYYTQSMAPIAGSNPALYAVLTAWMMLVPEVQVFVFFAIPIRIKWLILGVLGIHLLTDISHGSYLSFAMYLTSTAFGYFYALLYWETHGPFPILHRFEKSCLSLVKRWKSSSSSSYEDFTSSGKIYDFRTGKIILNDDEFLEACLSKISLKGKNSLTLLERLRLRKISKSKQKSLK